MRLKTNQMRDQMIKDVQVKRKVTMEKEKHMLKKQHQDDLKDLMYAVKASLTKMITQRRKEFEK